jgi:hypothetical protein
MSIKDVQDVLPLREEQGVLVALHSHTEKEMQRPKILHCEFLFQSFNDTVQELRRGGCEHDVINIKKQVDSLSAMMVDEQ